MRQTLLVAALATLVPFAALAQDDDDDDDGDDATASEAAAGAEASPRGFGLAGILSRGNREALPPITLSAGEPLAEAPLSLRSGTYYTIDIEADGSQELALVGPEFFRAVWINEIVIEGLEIRPLGLDSVEFDEAGTMSVSFVAIIPGTYEMRVPGSTGETQRVEITIE